MHDKLLITPTAYKGTLKPQQAAGAMVDGASRWRKGVVTDSCPFADGGDGFLDVIAQSSGGQIITTGVTGPLGKLVQARWVVINDGQTAVIEAAEANGHRLLRPEQRDPFATTTMGVGELIDHALQRRVREIIVGIGGSATNDGGAGMAYALGATFKPDDIVIPTGADLIRIRRIDKSGLNARIFNSSILVACDVNNPLYGPNGAAFVYGPQKFRERTLATPEALGRLDNGLRRLAEVLDADDQARSPGMGAAGGLGFGLAHFLNAELKPGVEVVAKATRIEERMEGVTAVITGEGSIDYQSMFGKVVGYVAQLAKARGIPVIGLAGKKGEDWQRCVSDSGLTALYSIVDDLGMSEAEASANAAEYLAQLTAKALTELGL